MAWQSTALATIILLLGVIAGSALTVVLVRSDRIGDSVLAGLLDATLVGNAVRAAADDAAAALPPLALPTSWEIMLSILLISRFSRASSDSYADVWPLLVIDAIFNSSRCSNCSSDSDEVEEVVEPREGEVSVSAAVCWVAIRGRLPGLASGAMGASGSLRFKTADLANTRLGGARLLMRGFGAGATGFGAGALKQSEWECTSISTNQ